MIKNELKKAFNNCFFYSAIGIATLIAMLSAFQAIRFYLRQTELIRMYEPEAYTYSGSSLYNNWLGASGNFYTYLFYFLIFLLCTLPYSWALYSEKKSGYIYQMLTRMKRKKYYVAKYVAAFVSGGTIAIVPMLLNLIVCAMFIPAYSMDQLSDLYIAVPQRFLWSSILYANPLLYILLYMLLSYVFCGVWATIGISVSFFVKSKISILISPFLFLIFVQVFSNSSPWRDGRTIIPSYMIAPRAYGYGNTTGSVVIMWIIAILIFDVVAYYVGGHDKDVI